MYTRRVDSSLALVGLAGSVVVSFQIAHAADGQMPGGNCVPAEPLYYELPAEINDFDGDCDAHLELLALWNQTMIAFNQQGIAGNPWSKEYDAPRINYLDPAGTSMDQSIIHPITWTAFPNRVNWYFHTSQGNPYQVPQALLYPLADEGRLDPDDTALRTWVKLHAEENLGEQLLALLEKHEAFSSRDLSGFAPLPVPSDICPVVNWNQPGKEWKAFGPPGPRGWKDEYNEWVTTRNAEGEILKVSFTSENPEYWFTLWEIDPNKVLELYQELVGMQVEIEDLYLKDKEEPLKDHRGRFVYNPLNIWNYGNRATSEGGGAVHLTSPPNTVGAEIYLGAAATIVRQLSPADYSPQDNNCMSQYGSSFRNSDPNIGLQGNQVVRNLKFPITLTNPISLYMQYPDFSNYVTPDGTDAAEFFHVVRGRRAAEAGRDYDQILHAVFEVPPEKQYNVSDIEIDGVRILWGAQIAETFNQALAASAIKVSLKDQPPMPAVKDRENPNPWPQPLVSNAVFEAVNNTKRIEAATIPLLPFTVEVGTKLTDIAMEALEGGPGASIKYVRADGSIEPGIAVTVKNGFPVSDSMVPGHGELFDTYVYVLDISIDERVNPGQYGVVVTNVGQAEDIPVPGSLIVVPAAP